MNRQRWTLDDWVLALGLAAIIIVLLLAMIGCGAEPDTATRPDSTVWRVEAMEPGERIAGVYNNRPRRPRVTVDIWEDGTWTANVHNASFTCNGVEARVDQPMYFHGTGAVDTTARVMGLWRGGVGNQWQGYGIIEAVYRQSWPARDTVLSGVIEGRWTLNVYGDCQAAHSVPFWLEVE